MDCLILSPSGTLFLLFYSNNIHSVHASHCLCVVIDWTFRLCPFIILVDSAVMNMVALVFLQHNGLIAPGYGPGSGTAAPHKCLLLSFENPTIQFSSVTNVHSHLVCKRSLF